MGFLKVVIAILATVVSCITSQECIGNNSQEIAGNWYCSPIEGVSYKNFHFSGIYEKVIDITGDKCTFSPIAFEGPLAPLNGEVSFHFRGPLRLKQFAVYIPDKSGNKRDLDIEVRSDALKKKYHHGHHRRHGHHNAVTDAHALERDVGDVVTVTMNGQVVSWVNEWNGHTWLQTTRSSQSTTTAESQITTDAVTASSDNVPTFSWPYSFFSEFSAISTQLASASGSPAAAAPSASGSAPVSVPTEDSSASNSTAAPAAQSSASYMPSSSEAWSRQAYYNAENQTVNGLVFLNNKGGQGSGVWDGGPGALGNSMSYMASDGVSCAKGPEILADVLLPDIEEFIIMTDKNCTNNDCGTTRPGSVAYHGFDGATKLFLMEFSMPLSGKRDPNIYALQPDMPAVWLLNADIPRTSQYTNCSCWATGCGEFDIFETLDSGDIRTKSTLHSTIDGGDVNWIPRPTNSTMKAAVTFDADGAALHVKVLPDNTEFPTSFTPQDIAEFCDTNANGTVYDLQTLQHH